MPTMRRSTRVAAAAKTPAEAETPQKATRSKRTGTSKGASQQQNGTAPGIDWSVSSSPLSSISTPASIQPQSRTRRRRAAQRDASSSPPEHSSESANEDAVSELLSRASEAIQDEVERQELSEEDRERSAKKEKATPAKRRIADVKTEVSRSPAKGEWRPGKRGRPPKHILEQRRRAAAAALESGEGSATPTRRGKRARMSGSPAPELAAARENEPTDAAGEAKIGEDGQLLGGREYICPVFQSPFRANTQMRYVLSMDCCRFTGARDSYMLFKQHPRLTRIETTQEERDLLAERHMIPKVTRFRPIAMITARDAFLEFGAKMVKDGQYIIDDYWEARSREEARFPEGTMVASMDVYRDMMAAHAAGMLPGPTRKPRRGTPLQHRGSTAITSLADGSGNGSASRAATPTLMGGFRGRTGPGMVPGGLTIASALQQPVESTQGTATGEGSAGDLALAKPVFRRTRGAETAEAAFEGPIAAHRAIFSDDVSFVDGTPLLQSLAPSWPRLGGKRRRGVDGSEQEESLALVGVARDFNASLRMWREDNGSTWIDPHTGIRQIPESLQPAAAWAERVDKAHGGMRTTVVEPLVAFVEDEPPEDEPGRSRLPGNYPLALLPGQYQHEFPIHQTRFGQTYQQAVSSYHYHWARQLAVQQQIQMQRQMQQQRHTQQHPK
ncbi:chromatin structure-remodeling complex subunit RSC7 [Linderina pennispora]|nr:chromatin structure-remodeling complex subunit RSC7 [Linderina pennispora]